MKLNILGVDYEVFYNEEIKDNDGYCDYSIKKISICKTLLEPSKGLPEIENKKIYLRQTLIHEIIHAFHLESGFNRLDRLCNEDIVDWYARTHDKIQKVIDSINFEDFYK